jgi:regulator of replication initiation timing
MSALEAALAFVFVSNAVFLVAAGVVLYRILDHTRVAHEALVAAADETRHAGKQLQHLAHASHDKLGKLGEGGGEGADAATLERLTKLVQDLVAKAGGGGGGEGHAAPAAGDGDKSDRPHRSELDRALAHNHRLRSSLEQLRLQLDEAMKTIADMRRDERIASTEAMENMRQLVTRLNGQLELARRKARESEKRAQAMEGELQQVRSMIDSSQSREDLSALEQRLDQMQHENSHLTGEVDELKELIKRTLREKDFIEDRFLKLDSVLEDDAATDKVEFLAPADLKPKA